ncbi:O-antigen ligase family protein [Ramlibacter sp.]|uniref:O-antigen ligase family protein n=1 Tax=Ramlibacter sp. TaxID=1917967 RepID=UPI0017FC410E|nr:O-antigen ligase family protein [Ramlibacter sp.]MBA2675997.1 O-antigen ligase family protein [Ramlibacter sp.]
MAKKRRTPPTAAPPLSAAPPPPAAAAPGTLPAEAEAAGAVVAVPLLALMMFLAPALGVPHEEMLQDTMKSIVVSFGALLAAFLLLWRQRGRTEPLHWHAVVWLPLLLMAYALGSMAWSHAYLGGVEAIRWFVFSLLVWLGLNTLSRERLPTLAWGIHAGALVASLWTALQFWADLRLFPQGPNPASTFVNRNFFAEFAVCTLPFSAILLARARRSATVALLALSTGLTITAILMTGTRAALIALWVQLLVVWPLAAWRCRGALAFGTWPRSQRWMAVGLLAATVLGLGAIPSGNDKVLAEQRGVTALERGFVRTRSIRADDASLGVRMIMWKATAGVIRARPLSGVGAGAWESDIPLYQAEGTQLETDYYVHNEFLQLLAEYGLAGWAFLLALLAYLAASAWRTWQARDAAAQAEAPWRAVALCSLLAFLIVSNVGFPWRMAATGALFALCLGMLAASDARLGLARRWAAARLPWRPAYTTAALAVCACCLTLAVYITQRAAESERKIVQATRLALTITGSGDYNNPRWDAAKRHMLELIREGVALNRHYRKITPMVADELARWGDWNNAIWIWASVLSSRPYVVAILTNVAKGYVATGHNEQATAYLERARRIQPNAPAVRALEMVMRSRAGHNDEALALARKAMDDGIYDPETLNAAFVLAAQAGDYPLAQRAHELRVEKFPETRAGSYLQLGHLYGGPLRDPQKALQAYRQALAEVPPAQRQLLLAQIPPQARASLESGAAPAAAASAPQMSSSKP